MRLSILCFYTKNQIKLTIELRKSTQYLTTLLTMSDKYILQNRNAIQQVVDGKTSVGSSFLGPYVNEFFDISHPVARLEINFISSAPKPVNSFGNLTKPFSARIWLALTITLFLIALGLSSAHSLYSKVNSSLILPEPNTLNFFLFPFCKLTEPEPLPWFLQKGTGGHFLVFIWAVLSLMMVMFYQSNLRAHLIDVDYEKPIDSLQDVLDQSFKIYISQTVWDYFSYSIY